MVLTKNYPPQNNLLEIFRQGGVLSNALSGYQYRDAQVKLADAIDAALSAGKPLIAEAGTGTGKTFAYLVPALLSGMKVQIATGTRNLQDQLFHKDLPVMIKSLGISVRTALLKGRSNYLCLYRLDASVATGMRLGATDRDIVHLEKIQRWAAITQTGDIAEVFDVPEVSDVWRSVTSTAENCLGADCPIYDKCHVMLARKSAQDADIVVVNHHLIWADWSVKSDGFGELLPKADAIIIDEAHQFPEIASQFLGVHVGSRQLLELSDDIQVELSRSARDMHQIVQLSQSLRHQVATMRLSMGQASRKDAWQAVLHEIDVQHALSAINQTLSQISACLKVAAIRSKGIEVCLRRTEDILLRMAQFQNLEVTESISWFETHKRSFSLHKTPIDIRDSYAKLRETSGAVWVFTSATLSIAGTFDYFSSQLGLIDVSSISMDSPFDYAKQSLLYLPDSMPDPSTIEYNLAVLERSLPILQHSGGRAFMLFTTHQALAHAALWLAPRISYPLFVQGQQPKTALLEAFKSAGNGVLLGTSSFWEGVDVRGDALTCVIIDKLPFASPGDPVVNARIAALRQQTLSPFMVFQLPLAVIALKQGAGRLIRDIEDWGVLVLFDPRIKQKSYGKTFLKSLPQMKMTNRLEVVAEFYHAHMNTPAEHSSL